MNKIRIRKIVTFILILIASFVILNINVKSVTADGKGACSGHGGVACSIGPDTDGSVVCNDGYRDSSVRYDDVAKCAINSNDDSTHNTPSSSKNINNNTKTTTTNKNEESIPIHALLFGGLFGICLFSKVFISYVQKGKVIQFPKRKIKIMY